MKSAIKGKKLSAKQSKYQYRCKEKPQEVICHENTKGNTMPIAEFESEEAKKIVETMTKLLNDFDFDGASLEEEICRQLGSDETIRKFVGTFITIALASDEENLLSDKGGFLIGEVGKTEGHSIFSDPAHLVKLKDVLTGIKEAKVKELNDEQN
jgi:hypothetical protein